MDSFSNSIARSSSQRLSPGPIRLLLYSHDGFGLGHLRRNTTIASRVVKDMPGSSVLLLVGCPLGAFFKLPPGVDFVKLPSIIKVNTGEWEPRSLPIGQEDTRAIRMCMIRAVAEHFRPHLFLVDHVPTGVWAELLPTLKMLKNLEDPPRVILGIRDILDAPEVTRELWRREGVYGVLREYYDDIFIYGCPEVFNAAAMYGLDGPLAHKVTYCGYLCSEEACGTGTQTREELQLRRDKLVVVAAGGGYDASPLMRMCVEALRPLGDASPAEMIIITGPLMAEEQREGLRRQAQGLPVRVLRQVEDNLSYLNAADLVITMAGYNTLTDAIRLRKRILLIPREGPSAEQRIRAQVFSRHGLVHPIYPEECSPAALRHAILENLDAGPLPANPLRMDGLTRATQHLMNRSQPGAAEFALA